MQTNRKYNKGKVQNLNHVLYFGNELVPEDARVVEIVKRISKELPHIKFIHMKFPEEILEYINQEFLILDVAKNIDKVTLIEDVNRLKSNIITTHRTSPPCWVSEKSS